MGCVQSLDNISESERNVEPLHITRRGRSKKIPNCAASGQTGAQFDGISVDVAKNKNVERKNLTGGVNEASNSKDGQGKAYSIFPKWKGYKMCNVCEDAESKAKKGFVHRGHCNRCSMVKEMKNNLRTNAPHNMNITAFANLLALVCTVLFRDFIYRVTLEYVRLSVRLLLMSLWVIFKKATIYPAQCCEL